MGSQFRKSLLALVLFATLAGCLEPYQPADMKEEVNILVIDGFMNVSNHTATVKLSYATALSSLDAPVLDTQASVVIEKEDGTDLVLTGGENGVYSISDIAVDPADLYRLHVRTNTGSEYFSDYITLTTTPPIDSITWKSDGQGVVVYANTHDDQNQSHYYRWSFAETWEYNAPFFSTYKMMDGEAYQRAQDDGIYKCWSTARSSGILISSSTRLSADAIRDFPLTFVAGGSPKLSLRYSILVEQQTLSKEAYDFWLALQKTTESLGGLFDPLPAQVLGNIKASDTNETVLGYFSGGQVSQKRIFIQYQDLPDELLRLRKPAACQEEDIRSIPIKNIPNTPNSVLLIDPIYVSGVGIVGYTTAISRCIDCQLQGGSTHKPDFW